MDDRRYRQSGYKDSGRPRETPRRPPDAPPPSGMLKNRAVSRCAGCGATLPVTAGSLSECPACRAALHACRQCAHFDPGHRFECTEAVPARIADKQQANDCASFSLRVTVERDTSSGAVRPDDARRGFGNLFKK
jgi:hypothetical protein